MAHIIIGFALVGFTLFMTCFPGGRADRQGFPHSRGKSRRYNSYMAWITGREH
jgi:hypothetical protein